MIILIQYPSEIQNIFKTQIITEVATASKNAIPHISPVWFAMDQSHLIFGADVKSKKIQNLMENPRIAVSVGKGDAKKLCITILGQVEIYAPGDPEFERKFQLLVDKHPPQSKFKSNRTRIVEVVPRSVYYYKSGEPLLRIHATSP